MIFDIVFRYQGGGGFSLTDFTSKEAAVRKAEKWIRGETTFTYYAIYLRNCDSFPYGDLAFFKGDKNEFIKNNGKTPEEKEKELKKWNHDFLALSND